MKTIQQLKTGDKFWHHGMMYKVVDLFTCKKGSLRATCITYGGIELFRDPTFQVSTKAL